MYNKILQQYQNQEIKNELKKIEHFDFELAENEISDINNINEDYRVRYNPDTVDYFKV